jgi:hypothetical protein
MLEILAAGEDRFFNLLEKPRDLLTTVAGAKFAPFLG